MSSSEEVRSQIEAALEKNAEVEAQALGLREGQRTRQVVLSDIPR